MTLPPPLLPPVHLPRHCQSHTHTHTPDPWIPNECDDSLFVNWSIDFLVVVLLIVLICQTISPHILTMMPNQRFPSQGPCPPSSPSPPSSFLADASFPESPQRQNHQLFSPRLRAPPHVYGVRPFPSDPFHLRPSSSSSSSSPFQHRNLSYIPTFHNIHAQKVITNFQSSATMPACIRFAVVCSFDQLPPIGHFQEKTLVFCPNVFFPVSVFKMWSLSH